MIDSSLIGGLQPTGSALLLAGGVGPASAAVAGAAAMHTTGVAGALGGAVSDGFRERFEANLAASVELAGTESVPAGGRTVVGKGGDFGRTQPAQSTGELAGLKASLGQRSQLEGERVQEGVEDASKVAGDGARTTEQFSGTQVSGTQVSGPAEKVALGAGIGTRTGTVAQPLSFVVEPAKTAGDAAWTAAGTVAAVGSRVPKREDGAAAGAPAGVPISRLHARSSLKAGLIVKTAPLMIGGASSEAVVSAPHIVCESEQKVQAVPLPQIAATIPAKATSVAVSPAKTTPVARAKYADAVARPAVGQGADVAAAATGKPEPAFGMDQGSGGLTKTDAYQQPGVMSLATPVVVSTPMSPVQVNSPERMEAASAAVGMPVPPVQVNGLLRPVAATPSMEISETKGTVLDAGAGAKTGVAIPLAASNAVRGCDAPSLLKKASDGVAVPQPQAPPGAAVSANEQSANEQAAAKPQSHGLRAGDLSIPSKARTTVSGAGSIAKDAGSSDVVEAADDTGANASAALGEIAQHVGVVSPTLTIGAEAPAVVAGTERGNASVKALSAARGSLSAPVTAGASVMGTAQVAPSPLQAVGERADAPASGKETGEAAPGAKAVSNVASGTTPGVAAATVSPQIHAEVTAETKTPLTALPGQTTLERTHAFPGIAGGGEGLEHTTLAATPNVLEVGVASGTNGWLKVRAEMDGAGGVAASVVTTTASAAEALHKELPSLSAYLRDESVGVSSLVVNRAEGGTIAHDATANFGAGSFGAGSQAGRGGQASPGDVPVRENLTPDGIEPALRGMRSESLGGAAPGAGYGAASGGWLNVVA